MSKSECNDLGPMSIKYLIVTCFKLDAYVPFSFNFLFVSMYVHFNISTVVCDTSS